MNKIELLNTLKRKQYEYTKKTTARVGLDIYGSVIELVKSLDVAEKSSSILKAKAVIFEQPQLNENQQQVLIWLKEYYKENRPFTTAFGAIRNVASKRWAFIKQNLTEDQQEYVLEAFSRWAQEQEEE